jgi:hypothetical protein
VTVTIQLGSLGHYSGFITMGDNNIQPGTPPQGEVDQFSGISGLVSGAWVVGEARGMLPWVGSFKLLLDGNAGYVPPESWQLLGLTLSAVVLAGFGLHYLFRVEGIEDPRRLAEERATERRGREDSDEETEEWDARPRGRRWRQLREWLAESEDEEGEPEPPHRRHRSRGRTPAPKSTHPTRTRGRPHPTVRHSGGLFHRRTAKHSRPRSDDQTL